MSGPVVDIWFYPNAEFESLAGVDEDAEAVWTVHRPIGEIGAWIDAVGPQRIQWNDREIQLDAPQGMTFESFIRLAESKWVEPHPTSFLRWRLDEDIVWAVPDKGQMRECLVIQNDSQHFAAERVNKIVAVLTELQTDEFAVGTRGKDAFVVCTNRNGRFTDAQLITLKMLLSER